VSIPQAAAVSFPREEALLIASLLALTGGYLDAYTWIVHRAFANAQTANLVFLWLYLTGGEWGKVRLCALAWSWLMFAKSCAAKGPGDQHPDQDRLPVHYLDPA
jgi:uncharacterized membrane protein YoaK (UPF0700 family)